LRNFPFLAANQVNALNSLELIFVKNLVSRLQDDRQEMLEGLLNRLPHEEYLYKIGQIRALTTVFETIEDVWKTLNSPEK
jgi:hypothetical protein